MSTISGVGGLLNGVAQFQQFTATSSANLQEFIHAGTGKGGRQRRKGVFDWNYTYNSYGALPEYLPGDLVSFLGSIDGAVGLAGPSIITQQVITWTPEGNLAVSHVGTGAGDGKLARGAAVVTEPDPSDLDMSDEVCVELNTVFQSPAVPVWVPEDDTRQITLTLSISPIEYSSCSTQGSMRRADALWDVALSYDVYTDDFALLPQEGDPYQVRIETFKNSGLYWELAWMRVNDLTNMIVNKETGELVGATVNMMASIVEDVDVTGTPTPTLGAYSAPGGTIWRPEGGVIPAGAMMAPKAAIEGANEIAKAKKEARSLMVEARRKGRALMREGGKAEGLAIILAAVEEGRKAVQEVVADVRQKGNTVYKQKVQVARRRVKKPDGDLNGDPIQEIAKEENGDA